MSSKVWTVLSDWPSVYGWKVVLKCKVMPKIFYNLGQNQDMNRGSRSNAIDIDTPWSLTISSIYSFVNLFGENVLWIARKCADLVSLSIITQMASWSVWARGKPMVKSIVVYTHFHSDMGKDWRVSMGFWCFVFTYWHTKHLDTNSTMSLCILDHQ